MADGPETEIHMSSIGRNSGPFRPVGRETVHGWLGIRYFNGDDTGGGTGPGAGNDATGASGGNADGQSAGKPDTTPPQPGGQPSNGGGSGGQGGSGDGDKKFTQADIDKAVQDRVNREKKKQDGADAKVTAAQEAQQAAERQTKDFLDGLRKLLPGGEKDTPPDPAALQQEVSRLAADKSTVDAENASLRTELAAWKAAVEHGANPLLLMDRRSFLDELGKLDRKSDKFGEQLDAAVKAAVERDESLKAPGQPRTPRPDPSQGSGRPAPTGGDRGSAEAARRFGTPQKAGTTNT